MVPQKFPGEMFSLSAWHWGLIKSLQTVCSSQKDGTTVMLKLWKDLRSFIWKRSKVSVLSPRRCSEGFRNHSASLCKMTEGASAVAPEVTEIP